jgi:hypothetical protein
LSNPDLTDSADGLPVSTFLVTLSLPCSSVEDSGLSPDSWCISLSFQAVPQHLLTYDPQALLLEELPVLGVLLLEGPPHFEVMGFPLED